MGAVMHLHFSSSLSKFTEANTSFDAGVLRVAYTGANQNGSYISKETFEKCMATIYNCPIVCFYDRDTDSIGGHDVAIVKGADGMRYMANLTTPVGVVPESAQPYWETVTEDDGSEHEYLCVDVLLWKRQEAYRKIRKDGVESESMEINVFEMEKDADTGLSVIRDFEFTAFCLLGSGIDPCFESASLEVFSQAELKRQVEEMMTELKHSLQEIKPDSGIDDTSNVNLETEGGSDLEDETKIVENEPVDEQFSAEVDPVDEPEQDPEVTEPVAEETFELNSNLREQLLRAVCAVQVMRPWGMDQSYWMVDFDAEENKVYYEDLTDDCKLFGSPYTMDGDEVVIDFEDKTQMKWAIVPFDQGSAENSGAVGLIGKYAEALTQASEMNEKFSSAEEELQELRRFKKEREDSDRKDEICKLFAGFAELDGNESFEALRTEALADVSKYSMDALEEKCFAIRGRAHITATFSLKEPKAPKQLVESEDHDEQDPYHGLFQKYGIVK